MSHATKLLGCVGMLALIAVPAWAVVAGGDHDEPCATNLLINFVATDVLCWTVKRSPGETGTLYATIAVFGPGGGFTGKTVACSNGKSATAYRKRPPAGSTVEGWGRCGAGPRTKLSGPTSLGSLPNC